MGLRILRRPGALLGAGFIALGVVVLAALALTEIQRRNDQWVKHSLEIQMTLWQVRSIVQGAETSQRGYIVSGLEDYLVSYDQALVSIEPLLGRLAAKIRDNPTQAATGEKLAGTVRRRLEILKRGVELRRERGFEAARGYLLVNQGDAISAEIKRHTNAMGAHEATLLDKRQRAAAQTRLALQAALVGSFFGLALVTRAAYKTLGAQLQALRSGRDELARANDRLTAEAARRHQAESQVQQMQKMEAVGQLTGGIAHDFNNMLSVIIGSLELARRRMRRDPHRAEVYIDNALDGAQRAAGLTARLLVFSRQAPLAPRPLDPNKMIGGISDLLHRTLGERVNIEIVLGGGTWPINVDPNLLENAILNLCVNARDAMPNGGKLTIETSNSSLDETYAAASIDVKAGQYVLISVSDTGTGMSPEVAERVFEPFFTTKEVGQGTGLGLSQVYGFVKQSGGHVKVYSEVGLGACVKLYLPRFKGAAPVDAGHSPSAPSQRARPGETVFVVEDDEKVRQITSEALRDLGYRVIQASNGEEALRRLPSEAQVDLLITDIVMPGMTGRALADQILNDRPALRVLYMTGYSRNAIVHNGVLDFGVAFLQKPFSLEQLAQKVRDVLDGRGANR